MKNNSYTELINKYLDWDKVEDRLKRFNHIGEYFDINTLRNCSSEIYACHYLAWRLGVWDTENSFLLLDSLLQHASSLKGWSKNSKKSQTASCDYGDFFGFLWELQMAKRLSSMERVSEVEWLNSGPDLKVTKKYGEVVYVECYTYRKAFVLELYIQDVLSRIHRNLTAYHVPCTKFSITREDFRGKLLDDIFSPFLDESYLQGKIQEASIKYPVVLYKNEEVNFYVYLNGVRPGKHQPGIVPNASGDQEEYLSHVIKEAVENKTKNNPNNLRNYRPNLLAINFLLSNDFQMALNRQNELKLPPPIGKSEHIDKFYFGICGIGELPGLSDI